MNSVFIGKVIKLKTLILILISSYKITNVKIYNEFSKGKLIRYVYWIQNYKHSKSKMQRIETVTTQ